MNDPFKVVVLDAVFYNLALILQSHLRTGKGKVPRSAQQMIIQGGFFKLVIPYKFSRLVLPLKVPKSVGVGSYPPKSPQDKKRKGA